MPTLPLMRPVTIANCGKNCYLSVVREGTAVGTYTTDDNSGRQHWVLELVVWEGEHALVIKSVGRQGCWLVASGESVSLGPRELATVWRAWGTQDGRVSFELARGGEFRFLSVHMDGTDHLAYTWPEVNSDRERWTVRYVAAASSSAEASDPAL